jgi:SAM-dependent methyltransferase
MNREELERATAALFHGLHVAQGEDPHVFDRLSSLLSTDYLGLPSGWFEGKTCLDAGCGANAHATYALLRMGAKKVCAFDVNPGVLESAPKYLAPFEGRYELTFGNVLAIAYRSDAFDYVHCNGVLHHSADVIGGLRELARVTRPGGVLFVGTYGKGGLVRDVVGLLRERYRSDGTFRDLIDHLDRDFFVRLFTMVTESMNAHGDELAQDGTTLNTLLRLFDNDLVLTIKDRIAAPVYHEHADDELIAVLQEEGFADIQRLTRYPTYTNIRRFLSPLYCDYNHPMARLFYGSGEVQLKATKA